MNLLVGVFDGNHRFRSYKRRRKKVGDRLQQRRAFAKDAIGRKYVGVQAQGVRIGRFASQVRHVARQFAFEQIIATFLDIVAIFLVLVDELQRLGIKHFVFVNGTASIVGIHQIHKRNDFSGRVAHGKRREQEEFLTANRVQHFRCDGNIVEHNQGWRRRAFGERTNKLIRIFNQVLNLLDGLIDRQRTIERIDVAQQTFGGASPLRHDTIVADLFQHLGLKKCSAKVVGTGSHHDNFLFLLLTPLFGHANGSTVLVGGGTVVEQETVVGRFRTEKLADKELVR